MSGTTNGLGPGPNFVGGFASITIDGTQYMLVSDAKYGVSKSEKETKWGMDGQMHGYAVTQYIAGFIEATLRDSGSLTVGNFEFLTNSEVQLALANGKVVSGLGMVCTKAIEVDPKEGTFSVRFEGANVQEQLQ